MKRCLEEKWNMAGNVRRFLSAEKSYTEAYRCLLRNIPFWGYDEREQIERESNDYNKEGDDERFLEHFAFCLKMPIKDDDDYEQGLNVSGVVGVGFNSAGLSKISYDMLRNKTNSSISHVHLRHDQIFNIGYQLGNCYNQIGKENNVLKAHKISEMRNHLICPLPKLYLC